MNHHHNQTSQSFHFADRSTHRQPMAAATRQTEHYGGGFDEEPMSDTSFFNPNQQHSVAPSMYGMDQLYGSSEFTQIFDRDANFTQLQRFQHGDYDAPSSQFDRPISSAGRSFAYGMHHYNPHSIGVTALNQSTVYGRPISSAGHSSGSGLQRFSKAQNPYMQNHQQLCQSNHRFQFQEHERYPQELHVQNQMHHDFRTISQNDQHFNSFENPFIGSDPREMSSDQFEAQEFYKPSFNHPTRHTMPVRNPYAQKPQRNIPHQQEPTLHEHTAPPREIVLQNNMMNNAQNSAVDDASLAFDDAFL
jgi:hypothetical protein